MDDNQYKGCLIFCFLFVFNLSVGDKYGDFLKSIFSSLYFALWYVLAGEFKLPKFSSFLTAFLARVLVSIEKDDDIKATTIMVIFTSFIFFSVITFLGGKDN